MAQQRGKGIDYSIQLDNISNPVESRAGELNMAAGRSEGQAAAIQGQTTANALTFLGTAAIAADKGRREAGLSKEITGLVDKLEGFGEGAKRATSNLNNVQDDLASFADNGPQEPEHVAKFGSDVMRFIDAQDQGRMTRDQVVMRIGAAVKKYSAEMPGYAGDFRKVAAELTGVSNIDVLGVNNALTQQSAQEKAAARAAEMEQQAIAAIAGKQGKLPSQVTRQDLAWHYAETQMANRATYLDNAAKVQNLGQAEADKVHGQRAGLGMAQIATQLASDFENFTQLNTNGANPAAAQEFGLQMAGAIARGKATLTASINKMRHSTEGLPLSGAEADKLIANYSSTFDAFEKSMATIEGRNAFAAIVKNANGNAQMLMDNLTVAAPNVAFIGKMGVMPALFQAWTSLPKEEFATRFPWAGGLQQDLGTLLKSPTVLNALGAVIEGKPVDFKQVAKLDPEAAKVAMASLIETVREAVKNPVSEGKKPAVVANILGQLGSTLNLSVPTDVRGLSELLLKPDMQAYLSGMTPELLSKALGSHARNIPAVLERKAAEVNAELEKLNSAPADVKQGWVWSLTTNGFGQQSVERRLDRGEYEKWLASAGGPGIGRPTYENAARGEYAQGAAMRGEWANVQRMVETSNVLRQTYDKGIAPHIPAIAKVDVPRNVPDPVGIVATPRQVRALGMGESGGNPNAVGDNGKALGLHQMHPEAAEESGITPEDRKDPAKSTAGATVYFSKQLTKYGGDQTKAVAAWNMGPTGFANHLKKYGDIWQLKLPDATKGLIERYYTHLGGQ